MNNNDWGKMQLEFYVNRYYRPGYDHPIEMTYKLKDTWYSGDKNKTPLQNSEEIKNKLLREDKHYAYGRDKENETDFIFSYITEMGGKHLNGKPVTRTDIINIFDDLESKLPPIGSSDNWVIEYYTLDILVPVKEKSKKYTYTCNFEIAPSAALDRFISKKQEFLEMYQVGSDEFAYDYEEEITKGAKSIFGKDRIETAIYDFGGDSEDFKILIELITPNEYENNDYFYFRNRSNNVLPEGITVQACLKMQNYSYNLVNEMYESFISIKNDSNDD